MSSGECELGLIGLGVMGRNLALNIAEHRFTIAGYDRDPAKTEALAVEGSGLPIRTAAGLAEFVDLLAVPRAVLILVPAGAAVDAVIRDSLLLLARGDLLIDGGNSHFRDTDRRIAEAMAQGCRYLGLGVSGGEAGARRGPSLMPGGAPEAYERVRAIFEAAAARVDDEPCVAWLGPGSAGHYVKMVHNGIEYGMMQLIAESYDLMKRGLGFDPDRLESVYADWNQSELSSYLLEITARIFRKTDERAGGRLIDRIRDEAGQKGTGMWTSQDAMSLHVPAPAIDAAVSMRDLSGLKAERADASRLLARDAGRMAEDADSFVICLRNAYHAAQILTYVQGFALLKRASETYGYGLALDEVARIWRGGCIIRASLLESIRAACRARPDLPNLLLGPSLAGEVMSRQEDLRAVVSAAAVMGITAPGFMASLAYLDGYRTARLPANLIQAQRDYFGAHTYERDDSEGTFHTDWDLG